MSQSINEVLEDTAKCTVHITGNFKSPEYYIHNGIDCKDIVKDLDYWKGSAIAHILRAGKKPGESEKEALDNAIVCLIRRVQELEGNKK